jgi:hypothetical protein
MLPATAPMLLFDHVFFCLGISSQCLLTNEEGNYNLAD